MLSNVNVASSRRGGARDQARLVIIRASAYLSSHIDYMIA